jgi:UDP:flavonoid glycosyltransferase YjiC (YdhE family)
VLGDPAHREKAALVRDEMATLPGLEHAVELLEDLVAVRRLLAAV